MGDTTTEEIKTQPAPKRPLKGMLLRVPLDVHAALRRAAYERHTSINKLASDELAKMTSAMFAQELI